MPEEYSSLKDYEVIFAGGDRFSDSPAHATAYRQVVTDQQAGFAMALLEKWGLVTAEDGGEDTAGRAKLRKLTPKEVVGYAFDVAHYTYEEIARRGWIVEFPDYETTCKEARKARERNDA